jgi:EpsI family protein
MRSGAGPTERLRESISLSTRREFIIAGAFCATAAAAAVLPPAMTPPPTGPDQPLEKLIPMAIGPWSSVPFGDILIPRGEKAEEKTYDDVVTRYYDSASAAGVMLLVAYGSAQVGDTELHRPEACYPVAGFRLERGPNLRLRFAGADLTARSMTARATGRTEQLLYWSRVGAEFPTTSLAQRWAALRQTLRGSIPDGVLVRMSTIAEDRAAAVDLLERFAGELLSTGGPALRRVLTGAA